MKNTGSPFMRRDLLKGAGSSTAVLASPNAQSQNRPKDAIATIACKGCRRFTAARIRTRISKRCSNTPV